MIPFVTSSWFGWLLTIVTLCLCFTSTLAVEFKWADASERIILITATFATIAVWFAIVVARFISYT